MRKFLPLLVLVIALWRAGGVGAHAGDDPETAPGETVDQALCRMIERSAAENGLPTGFFTRLIWQESSFRANVTSAAGAQGVAQFMPGSAAERGLTDPFDPEKAIPEAARLLGELAKRFGNLGLAAAAYNAGPSEIAKWLAGQADAPFETQAYVFAITARPLDDWAKGQVADATPPDKAAVQEESCEQIVEAMRRSVPAEALGATPFAPWGVQLAGNFSKELALAAFARQRKAYAPVLGDIEPFVLATRLRNRGARAFFRVRLPSPTRAEAARLCQRLHALGGSCIVLRS